MSVPHFIVNLLLLLPGVFCGKEMAHNENAPLEGFSLGVSIAGGNWSAEILPGIPGKNYFYPSDGDILTLKKKGFKVIRVPILWERVQPEPFGELSPRETALIRECIVFAKENDLDIILDLHNYCRRSVKGKNLVMGQPGLPGAALADFWQKFAQVFGNEPRMVYGIMNEPHDLPSGFSWKMTCQQVIDSIRIYDKTTTIAIPGNGWSSSRNWRMLNDSLKYLVDPADRLVYEAHCYFDKFGNGLYTKSFDEEEGNSTVGVKRMQPFVNWLRDNGKKGFLGELGIPNTDDRWLVVLDSALQYLRNQNIPAVYWAAGSHWKNYPLSIQPDGDEVPVQMKVLNKYLR